MDNQEPIQPPIFHHPLSGTGATRDILGFINAFMISDTILLRTEMSNINDNSDNRGVSEVFSNNLDEFTVDSEFAQKEVQCSICLDEFKEGDKCIRLPCEGEPHIFHSGSDSCSGIRPWLERNNTCPMCRHEFPTDNQHLIPPVIPPVIPPSLVPTSNITLTPGQIASLVYSNIDNVVPDMNDNNIIGEQNPENIPNPNSLENTISDMIEAYIRDMDRLPNGLPAGLPNGLMTEDNDLQRAIELSLNDIS